MHHPGDLYTYTNTNDVDNFERAYDRNRNIYFVARDFVSLARELKLKDIRKDAKLRVNEDKSSRINDGLDTELLQIEKYLQSETFKDGLIRLLADKQGLSHSDVNSLKEKELLPSEFIYCESLFLDYFIENKWLYTDNTVTSFLDEESSSLYLLAKADIEDMVDEVIVFVAENHDLDGNHQQSLSRILRKQMKSGEITELLDKKNMVSLPEDFDMFDDIDIFDSDNFIENSEWDAHNNIEETDFESDSAEVILSDNSNEIENWDTSEPNLGNTREATSNISNSTEFSDNLKESSQATRKFSGTLSLPKSNPNKQSKKKSVSDIGTNGSDIPPPTRPKVGNASSINSGEQVPPPWQGNESQKNKELGSSEIKNNNSRYPVYIYDSSDLGDTDELSDSNDRATITGSKGENLLIENQNRYLINSSNKLIKAKVNQEGYDITEESEDGEVVRYIEVKTCEGEWGGRGVSLTLPQFEFAKKHNNWCLFVVENLEVKSLQPTVHELSNPVVHVNRFIFDSSWKQIAISKIQKPSDVLQEVVPKPGDVYYVPSLNEEIKVVSAQPRGKLTKIEGEIISNGFNTNLKFDVSWELR